MERPAFARWRRPHLKSPLAEKIEGGKVMLDKFITPASKLPDACRHDLLRLWKRRIVGRIFLRRRSIFESFRG
jgi:hypothetical protein